MAIKDSENIRLPESFSVNSLASAQICNVSSAYHSDNGNMVQLKHCKKKEWLNLPLLTAFSVSFADCLFPFAVLQHKLLHTPPHEAPAQGHFSTTRQHSPHLRHSSARLQPQGRKGNTKLKDQ